MECAAILDVLQCAGILEDKEIHESKETIKPNRRDSF